MTVRISSIRAASDNEWDSVWQACDYATYFHGREWAAIWENYTDGQIRPDPLLVEFDDGQMAVLPFSCHRMYRGLIKHYLASPAGTYGGWISADVLGVHHAALLAEEILARKDLTWRLNPYDPLVCDVSPGDALHDVTQVLDLREAKFDEILRSWTKGHRSAVHRAQREGVTIRPAASMDDWRAYFYVYQDSLRRWENDGTTTSPYGWPLFETMADMASPGIRLWLAFHEDTIISGVLCFYARRHVVYWHGASLESHMRYRPANLLVYTAIQHACSEGYCWFDFNPSGGHEGVEAFKKSFGADAMASPFAHNESLAHRTLALVRTRLTKRTGL